MLRGGEEGGISFESIHGRYPDKGGIIKAKDLDLHRFIPASQLAAWAGAKPATDLPASPTVVLLTGANGFLGRFLLLDLLQRVSNRYALAKSKFMFPLSVVIISALCSTSELWKQGPTYHCFAQLMYVNQHGHKTSLIPLACMRSDGGRVIAIVRGKSDDAARTRLRSGYDSGDAELLALYDRLSGAHLSVYAGQFPWLNTIQSSGASNCIH